MTEDNGRGDDVILLYTGKKSCFWWNNTAADLLWGTSFTYCLLSVIKSSRLNMYMTGDNWSDYIKMKHWTIFISA